MSTDCKPFRITYEFNFPGGGRKSFSMDFNPENHEIIYRKKTGLIPGWASLEYKKCPECSLDPETEPYCPVALNMCEVLHSFSQMISTEKCFVRCTTFQRSYSKMTDVMSGLSSALAVIILSSPCPFLVHARPMARFHLPFFTPEESIVRMISFYLLSQYFVLKKGEKPDWGLEKLNRSFTGLTMVQEGMMERVKGAFAGDACINALHTFHVLVQFISFEIESSLECLEHYFIPIKSGQEPSGHSHPV